MTKWKKLPAIEATYGGCLNCGPRPNFFPANGMIAIGFGYAGLHRNREPVYIEPSDSDTYMTGAQAEVIAAADPDHDWQIVIWGPLSSRTYQRHGPDEWALIAQGKGFA